MPNGADAIACDGGEPNTIGLTRNVGVPFEDLPTQVSTFANPVGNGTPELRLQEQDRDGVDAEIMFTWADQMMRNAKDDELYLALVYAYNEYLAEEYMSVAPDRLFPQGTIPTTGVDDAVQELEHCAKLGLKGVTLTAFPNGRGYPASEDDRFWAAALDLRIALAKHGGGRFSGPRRGDPCFLYPRTPNTPDLHKADAISLLFSNASNDPFAVMQMAYAGVFDRFPNLQMYFAETMAGWIPFLLFMVDDNYRRYQPLMRHFWGVDDLERKPSEYMKEHTQWGFLYDPVGVQGRDAIGVDRIMFSTDFPHAAGDWPNTRQVIEDCFAGVPEAERHMMLAGSAVRYWHLL
jgi:predicted TIM-barrel fold metal-dependent hydrolase